MRCTPAELELKKRFETFYEHATTPAMQAIERKVCGCDYGGISWLSRAQADDLGTRLDLAPGKRLLDLGAGSGWPAIYLVKQFECDAVLVDLPEIGLRIARKRADDDGVAHRVETLVADAADLPFPSQSFDVVSHCDLLCCLLRKKEVLENCRRVIRPDGRMVFTVISIMPGLSDSNHQRALSTSPDFVESQIGYQTLLEQTGWSGIERIDITSDYEASCDRQIEADLEHEEQLVALLGRDEFDERVSGWRETLTTIRDRLVIRELFVATP